MSEKIKNPRDGSVYIKRSSFYSFLDYNLINQNIYSIKIENTLNPLKRKLKK